MLWSSAENVPVHVDGSREEVYSLRNRPSTVARCPVCEGPDCEPSCSIDISAATRSGSGSRKAPFLPQNTTPGIAPAADERKREAYVCNVSQVVIDEASAGDPDEIRVREAAQVVVAAVYRIDYRLTWNCRHLATAQLMRRMEEVCNRSSERMLLMRVIKVAPRIQ